MEKKKRNFLKYKPLLPLEHEIIDINGSSQQECFKRNNNINVLIWNTYKAKKKGFYDDLDKFLDNNDLILLQEYNFKKEYLNKIESLTEKEIVAAKSFYTRKNIPTGVCTISSVKNQQAEYIKSEYKEPITQTPKMALLTKYKVSKSKKEFIVINVHGINFVTKKKFLHHMKQVENFIEKYRDNPILIAGDFNVWNKYRSKILDEIAITYSLEQIDFSNDVRRLKLDRAFIKNIKCKRAEVLNYIETSDHRPLEIEIIL